MGLRPEDAALWRHIPTLQGREPLIVAETPDFEEGEGMRVVLFPHHLLLETAGEDGSYLLLPLETLLDAISQMNRAMGS